MQDLTNDVIVKSYSVAMKFVRHQMILETGLPIKTGHLFPIERELANNPSKRSYLSNIFTRFFERCGLEGYSFHCLRATYATSLASKGATVEEIAAALGHNGKAAAEAYIRKTNSAKMNVR